MSHPTHEDAALVVQLAGLYLQGGGPDASGWIWGDAFVADYGEFKRRYPPGSKEARDVATVAGYYETIGTLVKHELLNEELVSDWLAVEPIWRRLEPILIGWRDEWGVPRLYENFEALAARVPTHA